MREVRATAAAVVLLIITAASAHGQCVSSVERISGRGTNPRFLAGPTAWNGSILAVAGTELDRVDFAVRLYDEFGNLLAPNEKIVSSGEGLLDVLWTGNEFGVFSKVENFLALTRLGTDGKVLDPRVIQIIKVPLFGDDSADFAWSPQFRQYVIAHTVTTDGARQIRLTWLRPDGTFVREETFGDPASDSFVRLAVASGGTIGVFYEDRKSGYVMYVAVTDVIHEPRRVWSPGQDMLVTTRGNQFVMVRPALLSNGSTVARWQIVDTSAEVVRQDSRLVLGTGGDIEPVSLVAAAPGEYALSYLEWLEGLGNGTPIYRLARFGLDEERIADTYFAAAAGTRRRRERTDFDFEWTGSAYISLASLENDDDDDTFFVRMCPMRASISAPRFARRNQSVTFTASAEGGIPQYTYSWTWDGFHTAQGPTLETTFTTLGDHRITLTATDATGTSTIETFDVTIGEARQRAVRK